MSKPSADLWTGRYLSLLGSTFLAYVGFQMLVPTITAYIDSLHGSSTSAGLVYGAAAVAALIARSLSGSTMDRIGRQPVLLLGVIILIVTNLLLFVVHTIPLMGLIRFVQGIGWGMVSTALATVVSDMIPRGRLGEGIGYFALSIVFATSLSVIVGIWVMDLAGFPVMLGCSVVFFALALLLCWRMGHVPFSRTDRTDVEPVSLIFRLFERRALLPAFLCFLHSVAFSGIITFIMVFGREKGIHHVSLFFIGYMVMILISRPYIGRIFDRFGPGAVIVPGVLSMIVGLLVLSFAQDLGVLVVASLFYGLGFGTVQPSLQAWAIDRSPADRKGAANGTFLSSLDLGYAVGAVIMGAIACVDGYAVMYRLSPILLVMFLIIYGVWGRREKTTTPHA